MHVPFRVGSGSPAPSRCFCDFLESNLGSCPIRLGGGRIVRPELNSLRLLFMNATPLSVVRQFETDWAAGEERLWLIRVRV